MVAEELTNIGSPFSKLRVRPRRLYEIPLGVTDVNITPGSNYQTDYLAICVNYELRREVYRFTKGHLLERIEMDFDRDGRIIYQNQNQDEMPDDLAKLVVDSLDERKLTDDFCYDVGFPLRFFESLRDSLKGDI